MPKVPWWYVPPECEVTPEGFLTDLSDRKVTVTLLKPRQPVSDGKIPAIAYKQKGRLLDIEADMMFIDSALTGRISSEYTLETDAAGRQLIDLVSPSGRVNVTEPCPHHLPPYPERHTKHIYADSLANTSFPTINTAIACGRGSKSWLALAVYADVLIQNYRSSLDREDPRLWALGNKTKFSKRRRNLFLGLEHQEQVVNGNKHTKRKKKK